MRKLHELAQDRLREALCQHKPADAQKYAGVLATLESIGLGPGGPANVTNQVIINADDDGIAKLSDGLAAQFVERGLELRLIANEGFIGASAGDGASDSLKAKTGAAWVILRDNISQLRGEGIDSNRNIERVVRSHSEALRELGFDHVVIDAGVLTERWSL